MNKKMTFCLILIMLDLSFTVTLLNSEPSTIEELVIGDFEIFSSIEYNTYMQNDFEMTKTVVTKDGIGEEQFYGKIEIYIQRFNIEIQTMHFTGKFGSVSFDFTEELSLTKSQNEDPYVIRINNLPYIINMTEESMNLQIDFGYMDNKELKHENHIPNIKLDDNLQTSNRSNKQDSGGSLQLNSVNAYIIGVEVADSTIDKGTGASLKTIIHFNNYCSSISTNFQITAERFSYTSYIGGVYWSGPFQAGSNWALTLNMDWNFLNGKYVFGAGEYNLNKGTIYNCASDTYPASGVLVRPFTVGQYSGDDVVFQFVVHDGTLEDYSGRSLDSTFNDMSDQFENEFDVEIKRFYYQDSNLDYYSPYCWNGFKVIDESNSGIFSWGKESFGRKIGHDWQTADESTHVGNNGYDILMSVSGRSRRYFWDTRGGSGSNDAYAVGGAGYEWNAGNCRNTWNINSWIWDNHVQHETSHLFGPGDTETGSHVMNHNRLIGYAVFDYDDWKSSDITTINNQKDQYTDA